MIINNFSCDICNENNFSNIIKVQSTNYVTCDNCSVVRQYPYPSDLEINNFYNNYKTYKSTNSNYLAENSTSFFIADKELTFRDLQINKDYFIGKKLLDVGCATGDFINMMNSYNLSYLKGIDVSQECIQIARSKNLNCVKNNFLDEKEKYDIISLWHVIEHIRKPLEYLNHAFNLLNENGILLLETPVIGKVSNAFGSNWRYFMPVEHINLFSFSSLIRLSLNCGFKLQSFTRFGSGNDGDKISKPNKKSMDSIAKEMGWGDTLAICLIK